MFYCRYNDWCKTVNSFITLVWWKGIWQRFMVETSREWQSILAALGEITVENARAILGAQGTLAYTDGACIKNPGGPAGWSTILVSVEGVVDGEILPQAR